MSDLTHTTHAAAHPFVPCASLSSRPGGRDGGRCAAAGWQPRLSESSLLLYFPDDGNHAFTEHVNRSRRPNTGTREKKICKERREAAHRQSCAHEASSAARRSLICHLHSMSPCSDQLHHHHYQCVSKSEHRADRATIKCLFAPTNCLLMHVRAYIALSSPFVFFMTGTTPCRDASWQRR